MKISVIMPVCAYPDPINMDGEPHPGLFAALDSVANGGHEDVEVLIGSDGSLPRVREAVDRWAAPSGRAQPTLRYFEYPFSGKWGNPQRNALMQEAVGDVVCFQDQDDGFFPNALADVGRVIAAHPGRPLLFRMAAFHICGQSLKEPWVIWKREGDLQMGQIGGHMLVLPNSKALFGTWREDAYEGDWHFITETLERYRAAGILPCWRGEFISIIRPWAKIS